jgi:hypothetical protein
MFVTSDRWYGYEIGGLAGADAKCQAAADSAGLPGTYKAWLSDDTTDARDRLAHATHHPYVNPNEDLIAFGWGQLVGCGDLAGIVTVNEWGFRRDDLSFVWTGTDCDGTSTGYTCGNWASTSGTGTRGDPTRIDHLWTAASNLRQCIDNNQGHLYCLQQ